MINNKTNEIEQRVIAIKDSIFNEYLFIELKLSCHLN